MVDMTNYNAKFDSIVTKMQNLGSDIQATPKTLTAIDNGLDSISGGGVGITKELLDGSLTELQNSAGATSLKPYRFYEFSNLQKVNLASFTSIPEYTCNNCSSLNEVIFNPNISTIGDYAFNECRNVYIAEVPDTLTNIGQYGFSYFGTNENGFDFKPQNTVSIGNYAMQYSGLKDLQGTFNNIRQYAFRQASKLTNANIVVNGSIESYAFQGIQNVESFVVSGNVTSLGNYAFNILGTTRTLNNTFVFDFLNSSFSSIGSYAFQGSSASIRNSNFDIYLPNTLTSIQNYAFRYADDFNVFFSGESVPTIQSTTFNTNNNLKIFAPHNFVNAYRTETNWSVQASNIYGWASPNTFENSQTLPYANNDGYALTWYTDKELTTPITVVSDKTQPLYCTVGTIRIAVLFKSLSKYQASVVITDGTNTYSKGDVIPANTTLTITATGDSGFPDKYIFEVNGADQTSPYTFNVGENDLIVIAIYWDGVNVPVNPTFSLNTPAQVKVGFDSGVALDLWNIDDRITINIDNVAFEFRIADMKANRYEKVGGGFSNGVLEMVKVYENRQWNTTSNNTYATSTLREYLNTDFLALLPTEWQNVISEVNIPTATAGSQAGGSVIQLLPHKVFLMSEIELRGTNPYSHPGEGTVYDYYNGKADGFRVKQLVSTNASWWQRSPYASITVSACSPSTSGSAYVSATNGSIGVSVCFAF